jgi:DNA-3-methyladenine glycosylase II
MSAPDHSWQTQLAEAVAHLQAHDPILARVIAAYGPCKIEPHANYYQALVSSIIGQQLSVKAAASIRGRFEALFGGHVGTPAEILQTDPETLRSVGLSRPKTGYIQDLAKHIIEGKLLIDKLPELSNQEITKELVAVKGIGEWTAHMFMIFSLGRLDILPVGDLGIRLKALRAGISGSRSITNQRFNVLTCPYRCLWLASYLQAALVTS